MSKVNSHQQSKISRKPAGRVAKADLERLDWHLKQFVGLLKAKEAESYPVVSRKVA